MKVLITGHLGFVGAETTKYFREQGLEVIGFDLMDKREINAAPEEGFPQYVSCDIRNKEHFRDVVLSENPDRILHLAAIARFKDADRDPILAFETNVLGTRNVVDIAKEYGIPLVFSSTESVYMPVEQDPPFNEEFPIMGNSVYGCSKAVADLYVQTHSPHIVLRYAHLYGKEKRFHGLIGGFAARIERGLAPVLYGGKQSNDFCYIKDLVVANYLAVTASWDKWNQVYNIGTGEEIITEDAGQMICDVLGWKGEMQRSAARTTDPIRLRFDTTKAETMLGFKAKYDFLSGLKDMFAEMQKGDHDEGGNTPVSE